MGYSRVEKSEYSIKRPTTYSEQVEILIGKGLIINDKTYAIEVLKRVNYYRLSAYFLSLRNGKRFKEGVTFEQIDDLYKFDMRLRNLLMEHLEIIEIAFRSHISYLLAQKYGSLGYKLHENFRREDYHTSFLAEISKSLKRENELFIRHHNERYGGQFPIWVSVEVMSFGMLSKLYANMKKEDKNEIANEYYKTNDFFIQNWLLNFSYVRNICAHFGRLYNKSLVKKPKLFKEDVGKFPNDKIFATIFIMGRLSKTIPEWTGFVIELEALIEEYTNIIELDRIGFPANWTELLM